MAYIQSFSLYLLYLYSNWFKGSLSMIQRLSKLIAIVVEEEIYF